MCQIRKVISIFVPFKGNKRILNGLFYPILRLNSPSEIERVCSGICTLLRRKIRILISEAMKKTSSVKPKNPCQSNPAGDYLNYSA